jgi:hypothetical protein
MHDSSLEHQLELFQALCDGKVDPHGLAEILLLIHQRLGKLEEEVWRLKRAQQPDP